MPPVSVCRLVLLSLSLSPYFSASYSDPLQLHRHLSLSLSGTSIRWTSKKGTVSDTRVKKWLLNLKLKSEFRVPVRTAVGELGFSSVLCSIFYTPDIFTHISTQLNKMLFTVIVPVTRNRLTFIDCVRITIWGYAFKPHLYLWVLCTLLYRAWHPSREE